MTALTRREVRNASRRWRGGLDDALRRRRREDNLTHWSISTQVCARRRRRAAGQVRVPTQTSSLNFEGRYARGLGRADGFCLVRPGQHTGRCTDSVRTEVARRDGPVLRRRRQQAAERPPDPARRDGVGHAGHAEFGLLPAQISVLYLAVPRCCGALTPSTRLVSVREGAGWSFFRCRARFDDVVDGTPPRTLNGAQTHSLSLNVRSRMTCLLYTSPSPRDQRG